MIIVWACYSLVRTNFICSRYLKPDPKLFNIHGFTLTATLKKIWIKALLCFSSQLCTSLAVSGPKPVQISLQLTLFSSVDVTWGTWASPNQICLTGWNPDLGSKFGVTDTSPNRQFAANLDILLCLLFRKDRGLRRPFHTTEVTQHTHPKVPAIIKRWYSEMLIGARSPPVWHELLSFNYDAGGWLVHINLLIAEVCIGHKSIKQFKT